MVIEEERLDRLEARLHGAKALTPDLVTELIRELVRVLLTLARVRRKELSG
jgi:hypothetical protein